MAPSKCKWARNSLSRSNPTLWKWSMNIGYRNMFSFVNPHLLLNYLEWFSQNIKNYKCFYTLLKFTFQRVQMVTDRCAYFTVHWIILLIVIKIFLTWWFKIVSHFRLPFLITNERNILPCVWANFVSLFVMFIFPPFSFFFVLILVDPYQ